MNRIITPTDQPYTLPEKPQIRWIEAFPVETHDGKAYGIHDPYKIAPHPLVLPAATFVIAGLMDGTRTLSDIQMTFERQFKQKIPLHLLESIVRQLDEELYLDSAHFHREYRKIQDQFLRLPVRQAAHAGGAYERDPDQLCSQLNSLLAGVDPSPHEKENAHVSLLISPHIDLHRGGPGFAHAYRTLQNTDPADLYVILGTGHQSLRQYMTCTRKAFETPLGISYTDEDFVDQFSRSVGFDVFDEEFIHRDEHSIEFQVLFLQHVLGQEWQGKIVPILCGSFHEFIEEGCSPREDDSLALALDNLREKIAQYDGKVTVIAGVDMSHVGRRFGHAEGVPPSELERVTQQDQEVLDALISGNAETFYHSIEKVNDCNHVCGLTPIYMALDVVQPAEGKILYYDQAIEGDQDSLVSFTSAVFYEE